MRIFLIITMAVSCFPAQAQTYEFAPGPQAMFYYRLSVGGSGTQQAFSSFGLRMDNLVHHQSGVAGYHERLRRPPVFDLRMGKRGIEGIYLSGVDYYRLYRINRQNDEQAGAEEEARPTVSERVKGVIDGIRDTAPAGFYIGAGLGIALLLGAGD